MRCWDEDPLHPLHALDTFILYLPNIAKVLFKHNGVDSVFGIDFKYDVA